MCTVVFIPDNNKIYFASLRDESQLRPTAEIPELFINKNVTTLAPKDTQAGGTWVGINDFENVIILLNGGFENHKKYKLYGKSRGLIVSELLISEMPVVDWELMSLHNIEPFMLVVWSGQMLFHLVWDGNQKHRIKLDSTIPHILSSSTLYNTEAKKTREMHFQEWMASNPLITKFSTLNFFKSVKDPENGFIIDRKNNLKTLSFTFIELNNHAFAEMDYYDLQNFTHSNKSIVMKGPGTSCIPSINL